MKKTRNGRVQENPATIQYNVPWDQVNTDSIAWGNFISGLGIRMQHWSFMPYVIGTSEIGGLRNYDGMDTPKFEDKGVFYDNNGIYKYEGDVFVIWQSNSKNTASLPSGYYPASQAVVTINRHYIDTKKIIGISEFDKLVPIIEGDALDFASVNWEKVQHNPVGYDRLMFPAVAVDHLIDSSGIEYKINQDFVIEKGYIKWLVGARRPAIDNLTGEGTVYAIRYRYVPSFYIKYVAHEIRSHATIDPDTGDKKVIRSPFTAAVQIDWVFLQSIAEQNKIEYKARTVGDGGNVGTF